MGRRKTERKRKTPLHLTTHSGDFHQTREEKLSSPKFCFLQVLKNSKRKWKKTVKLLSPVRRIRMNLLEQAEKKFDPRDTTMTFVYGTDDLDFISLGDGDSELTAVMSCGHAVTPQSLTQWCFRQLNEDKYIFRCPVVTEGTKVCNKQWSYQEVRRLADLSVEEMKHFEETMARLAAADNCKVKQCPQCSTYVERMDLSNLCVVCTICTAEQKKRFQFCWQCLRTWKGPGPRSDRCDNEDCINEVLQLLKTCKSISLPAVEGVTDCPSVRACPTCGMRVEHNQKNCKNIHCPRCQIEFCFVCLKLKSECIKTSSPYKICPLGVAPRQTSIPVWQRK